MDSRLLVNLSFKSGRSFSSFSFREIRFFSSSSCALMAAIDLQVSSLNSETFASASSNVHSPRSSPIRSPASFCFASFANFRSPAFLLAASSASLSFLAVCSALSSSASVGASGDLPAGIGCSVDPHTGQGSPGRRFSASMPACSSRKARRIR